MDPFDQDIARLATAPAPPALAQLETAVWARLSKPDPDLGWTMRGALATVCLAMGMTVGMEVNLAAEPLATPIDAFNGRSALLPSTLLLSARP